jgi:hypothetical protein
LTPKWKLQSIPSDRSLHSRVRDLVLNTDQLTPSENRHQLKANAPDVDEDHTHDNNVQPEKHSVTTAKRKGTTALNASTSQ